MVTELGNGQVLGLISLFGPSIWGCKGPKYSLPNSTCHLKQYEQICEHYVII